MEQQAAQSQATRNAIEQARIAAIENDAERERATQDEQHRLNLQAVDDREEEMKKALYEYNKSVWENQNKKKDLKYSDTSEGAAGWNNLILTKDQQDELKALRDKENSEYARLVQDRYRAEAQAMRDFLSQYGTLEQRKLAITQDYEKKIAKASTQGEKMSLAKERDSRVAQLNAQSLAMDIDWSQTFKGLGNILQDIARETLSKVNDYMKTDEYKKLDATDKKAYQDLRNELMAAGGQESASPFSGKTWDDIAKYTEEYKQRVKDFVNASQTHRDAVRRLEEAQNELANATTDTERIIAQHNVETAQKAVNETAQTVTTTKNEKDEANEKVRKATDAAAKGLENFNYVLDQLTSGTLTGFFNGVSNVIASLTKKTSDDMEGIVGLIGEKAGSIVGAILSIIDALGEDPVQFVDDILDKVADVIKAVLEQLPQIIASVVEGVGNIVGGVVTGLGNLISGGALWGNGNEEEMEEEIARLSKANEGLAKSIETLSETISKSDSSNKESLDAYMKALEAERQWEENQRKAIDDRASEWTNTGYGFFGMGGKSSFNAHMAGNWWEGWKVFSDLLKERYGTGFGFEHDSVNSDTIWNLTPEEMRLLRDFAPKEWASLMNGDGHRNPSELIDEYINRAGEIESLTESLNKKLTGYSWEGFLDRYKSKLKDMKATTEDFAKDIEEIISSALLESLVNDEFKQRIKDLYMYIADNAGDGLDESELNFIRQENANIAEEMLARRQNLIDAGLIKPETETSEQSASKKGFAAMNQDTGEELNGRFTALQIAGETISSQTIAINAQLVTMTELMGGNGTYLSEIRNMMIQGNSFLEDIAKYSKRIYLDFQEKIEDIVKNTKNM